MEHHRFCGTVSVSKLPGLIFISARLAAYQRLFQNRQVTPPAQDEWRYSGPFRLERWQCLYHQPPLNVTAQLLSSHWSLSWSLVLKAIVLWYFSESPAPPIRERLTAALHQTDPRLSQLSWQGLLELMNKSPQCARCTENWGRASARSVDVGWAEHNLFFSDLVPRNPRMKYNLPLGLTTDYHNLRLCWSWQRYMGYILSHLFQIQLPRLQFTSPSPHVYSFSGRRVSPLRLGN